MNEQALEFGRKAEVIETMFDKAQDKFIISFGHKVANDTTRSHKALRECMQQLEDAAHLICKLHDIARIELTGREEPVEEEEYKLRVTKWMALKNSPPFVFDPEEFGIDSDDD